MKKHFNQSYVPYIFLLLLGLAACTPYGYLNPPFEPYSLFFIPPQVIYKTGYFSFQPPLNRNWGLWTNIDQQATRINKTKITICHRKTRVWINVLYLKLAAGKHFKSQRQLINAFVAGEKEYLTGKVNAPITETHLHQGFKGMSSLIAPQTKKINNTYFKVLKWRSRAVDSRESFILSLYITPARDLSGVFAIVMVSSKNSSPTAGNIKEDVEEVAGSFRALK